MSAKLVRRHVTPARARPGRATRSASDVRARLVDDRAWAPIAERSVDADARTLSKQVRIVLENCGEVDPLSLDDYRAAGRHAGARGVPDDA